MNQGNINSFSGNCQGIVLWGVTSDRIGKQFKDGLDNDGNGAIDEGIDTGIDGNDEAFFDGIDNDGDGLIDEDDESVANYWLNRFGSYASGDTTKADRYGFGFGDYKYDDELDAFVRPKPFTSWTLNEDTCQLEAPVDMPTDGKLYSWNEEIQEWYLEEVQGIS